MYLNPAEYVISIFQGVRRTGRILGRAPNAISKWRKRGQVPGRNHVFILEKAKELGIDITPSDLVLGRTTGDAA